MRKIALISDGRVSHGLYRSVLDEIMKRNNLNYMYIITGTHLSSSFGRTIDDIKSDGYKVYAEMPIDLEDEGNKQVKSIGKYILELTKLFEKDRPDIILAQGDRGITIATAIVGTHMGIPVAHTHGGEISKTFDEYTRHAITHYSSIHFPATKESAERLKKLGQGEDRIFLTGSTSVDYILKENLISKQELEKDLELDFNKKIGTILQHPVSEERGLNGINFNKTIDAVNESELDKVVVIYPNSDDGGEEIISIIKNIEDNKDKYSKFKVYKNIPFKKYLSLLKYSSVLIGNSSGGIIEAPVIGIPTINVGTRQDGRERSPAIIDVNYDRTEILNAIHKSLNDKDFKELVSKKICPYNPFNDGNAAKRIVDILESIKINPKLLNKRLTY